MKEEYFDITDKYLCVLLLYLQDGEHPIIYVIPTSAWEDKTNKIFVYRTYKGKKSKPEYGINTSKKNLMRLEIYKLENMIDRITNI